jgi:small conductance mechanosensitive channel
MSMNDSNISFVVRAWLNADDYWAVKFDLNKKIYTILPQKGIQFAYPQLNVNIKS